MIFVFSHNLLRKHASCSEESNAFTVEPAMTSFAGVHSSTDDDFCYFSIKLGSFYSRGENCAVLTYVFLPSLAFNCFDLLLLIHI